MSAVLEDVVGKTFDYIIAGGGTAGLTLAARLSEDPARTVLVLEAGGENIDDPMILRPGCYGIHFGNDKYAWTHFTVQTQEHIDERKVLWTRGKGLGGSSAINFFSWMKPPAEDINDFERLGNPGWNWERYNHALNKLEGFVCPSDESLAEGQLKAGLWQLGTEGILKITFPPKFNRIEALVQEALFKNDIPPAPNSLGGDPKGYFLTPNTHDPSTYTRSYATTAFYLPNKDRPNLTVLVNAHVTQVITEPTDSQDMKASGVEFLYEGKQRSVHATREVVLCAGALRSPQILELSGIGDPKILEKINVPVRVNLPGVGTNVQDHLMIGTSWELKDDPLLETMDILVDPAAVAEHIELHKTRQGLFTQGLVGYTFCSLDMISSKADEIFKSTKEAVMKKIASESFTSSQKEQYRMQLDRMKYRRPSIEFITFPGLARRTQGLSLTPGKKYFTLNVSNFHAFSRGTIHCTSNDPLQDPEFDPRYFEDDVDLQVLVEALHFARKLVATEPLKNIIAADIIPGPSVAEGNNEQMRDFVKKTFFSPWHTCSSCSMLPREKGGVVDPYLKVYGTTNLRVVDLSIIPIHIATHTQATVYAIAEIAAEIITGTEA